MNDDIQEMFDSSYNINVLSEVFFFIISKINNKNINASIYIIYRFYINDK